MSLPNNEIIFTGAYTNKSDGLRYGIHFLAQSWEQAYEIAENCNIERESLGVLREVIELTPDGPMTWESDGTEPETDTE